MDKGKTTKRKRHRKLLKGWGAVVLAAGKGTRMKSRVPKVLHQVCGKAMVQYPVDIITDLGIRQPVVVVSAQAKKSVRDLLGSAAVYLVQNQPLGTGHALQCGIGQVADRMENLLVMYGDCPLFEQSTILNLISEHLSTGASLTVLTAMADMNTDMGRVIRDGEGSVSAIVESRDVNTQIIDGSCEVNAGVYCFKMPWLLKNIGNIVASSSGERYLTSLIESAFVQGVAIETVKVSELGETVGINDRIQLAHAEKTLRHRILNHWMREGVTMIDPASTVIDSGVEIGRDTIIYPNTLLLGKSRIGSRCILGPGTVAKDSIVGSNCKIVTSVLEGAVLERDVDMGPFSHLRPGSYLEKGVHIGNFCEIKGSRLSTGVAMGHFGYLGNASVGANANIGAGTVTCNYDGKAKHHTVIEEGALIGSDTMLIAPVTVGKGAVTGAGSVVTKDVPPNGLVVGVPAKSKKMKAN